MFRKLQAQIHLSGQLLVAVLLLAAVPVVTAAEFDEARFTDAVERGMTLWNVPGLAVAVIQDGETVLQRGFGNATIGGAQVDEHTLFSNASTTKAMVVAGLLMLVDEQRLTLDDPVVQYIPELHFHASMDTGAITLRDLLAHRTGLPSTDFWTFHQRFPLAEQIRRMPTVAPEAGPRERLIYQNTMYELAGIVIERVSGKAWHKFLEERLWRPIGMRETYGTRGQIPRTKQQVLAHGVLAGEVRAIPYDLLADDADAAGSAWSSIHDMTLWAQFLLNNGVTASGKRLISETQMAEMFEPQQLASEDDFYPSVALTKPQWRSYGLGWFQQDFAGRRVDFHTGSLDGLTAIIGLDRAAQRAVIVMQNIGRAELRHALLWETMDATPAAKKRDWVQDVYALYAGRTAKNEQEWQAIEAARIANSTPSLPLAAYVGRYRNESFGDLLFAAETAGQNGPIARPARAEHRGPVVQSGMYEYEATHWHHDIFVVKYLNWTYGDFAEFRLGPDGKVAALNVFGMTFDRVE
ncbi:MAG: serine hydrolase [Woeseia sp.]